MINILFNVSRFLNLVSDLIFKRTLDSIIQSFFLKRVKMFAALTPKKICEDVANNALSKEAATGALISIIDGSIDTTVRAKCIEAFGKLNLKSEKIYKIIENSLISDENSVVRRAAAKVLFKKFSKKYNILPFKWAVQNEKSAIVIRILIDLFNSDPQFFMLKKTLIKRLEDIYHIIPGEINLFLNLEVLYSEFASEPEYKVGASWFRIINMLNDFPDSIGLIQRLYYLKLGGDKLKPLPKTVSSLSNLRNYFIKANK